MVTHSQSPTTPAFESGNDFRVRITAIRPLAKIRIFHRCGGSSMPAERPR
jgi:hypothetical protein